MSPQAPKPPAPKPPVDRHLARDVAKHIDRRRMRRKLLVWMLLVGALVLAALYLRCGRGWGLGGKGNGNGEGPGSGSVQTLVSPTDAGPRRCQIRIAADGITADGKRATVEEAVAACKGGPVADVLVTGGARESDWEQLKAAFERAGIEPRPVEPKGGSGRRP
jgi:hypothetical protein